MAAALIVAWLLLQARSRQVETRREEPVLALAVDVSASMTDNPGNERRTRAERALEFLKDGKVRRLARRYRLVQYHIGADLEEALGEDPEVIFNAPRSHIGSGLNRLIERLRAENVAGIILLSDGLDQSGEQLSAQSMGVPVFIPELEEPFKVEEQTGSDYWIAEVSYPKMMAVNWKGGVDVLIRRRDTGAVSFPIHLKQGSRILRTSIVQFDESDAFRQVSFTVEPVEVGQLLYQVEIAPDNDDTAENNRRDFLIDVSDPKNRVLYLEGVPRWEFKFLKRALLSEKNYQLSAFVRGGDGTFINFDEISGQAGGTAPQFTTETLSKYKVVVLGDMGGSALSDDDRRGIRDFVDKGGGLLLMGAGKAYGSGGVLDAAYLKELSPAVSQPGAAMKEGRFSVDLTPMGRTHPALGDLSMEPQLPPILSFWAPVSVGDFSTVLISVADGSPVLAVRRFGQGRVAMVLSDSLWRWQLGDSGGGSEKSLYNRFITQLVYWLAPSEKDVEKSTLLQVVIARNEVDLREKVTIGAVYDTGGSAEDEVVNCTITPPDGGQPLAFQMLPSTLSTDVGLSRPMDGYRCFFTPQESGKYDIEVSTGDGTQRARVVLLVRRPELEKTGAPLNREYLNEVASATGGAFVAWSDRFAFLDEIPYSPREFSTARERKIWDRWWWLCILIGLFCGEWWWRRKLDLV
jgi:uncharacterized membrane protein